MYLPVRTCGIYYCTSIFGISETYADWCHILKYMFLQFSQILQPLIQLTLAKLLNSFNNVQ